MAHMQIPAGISRQGSAEKLTDGEWITRWPIKDLLWNSNPRRKFMQGYFVGNDLFVSSQPRRDTRQLELEFAF
jgi:hypothetical protein